MGQAKRRKLKREEKKQAFNKKILADYCTASPDFNFSECCKTHDEDYEKAVISRWEADIKLRQCISRKGVGFYKYKVLPWVYWSGVRVFGGSRYGNTCRKKCKICNYFRNKTANLKKYFL